MVGIARQRLSRRRLHALVMAAGTVIAFHSAAADPSLPQGPTAVEGSITTSLTPGLGGTPDQTLTINTFKNSTIINWQSFNIANGNTVQFNQPGVSSRVLNRINSTTPSQIHGNLFSNGQVFLVNPAGVIFGASAVVNTGGLIAAAGNITNQNFLDGNYQFTNLVGGVENYGNIHAPVVGLVGRYVTQAGNITGGPLALGEAGSQFAPADVVILASGENVLIGEAFGSVFVSAPADLGPDAAGDTAPMSAGDVFSIAAWHSPDANTSAQTVRIASRGTAKLEGNINAAQLLDVSALNNLQVGGTVIAGNAMLRSDLGAIHGSGAIHAQHLALDAQGDIDLKGSGAGLNRVDALNAVSHQGSISFVNEGDMVIEQLSTSGGNAADILSAQGSLTVAGPVNVGALSLDAAQGAVVGSGLITASQLEVLAGLGVDLRGVVGSLSGAAGGTSVAQGSGESFIFDNESGDLIIGGVSATLDVLITSAGSITVLGGEINAGNNIKLTSQLGTILAHIGGMDAGNVIELTAGDAIEATKILKAEHLKLLASNDISATSLRVGSVEAQSTAGGEVNLLNIGDLLVKGVSTTGKIVVTNLGKLTIEAEVSGDQVFLNTLGELEDGRSIVIEATVDAHSTLAIDSSSDIITQNGGMVRAPSTTLTAGGAASLDLDQQADGMTMSATIGGDLGLTLLGQGEFTLSSADVGGNVSIVSAPMGDAGGGNIILNNMTVGGDIIQSTAGTITVLGTLQAGVDRLISLTGDKGIALESGSTLTFGGGVMDRRVLLFSSNGWITQDSNSGIVAGQLQAIGDNILLTGNLNQFSRFAALSQAGVWARNGIDYELGFTSFGGQATAGVTAWGGPISINGDGDLTINHPVFSVVDEVTIDVMGNLLVNSHVVANSSVTMIAGDDIEVAFSGNVSGVSTILQSMTGHITIAGLVEGFNSVGVAAWNNITVEPTGTVLGDSLWFYSTNGNITNEHNILGTSKVVFVAQDGSVVSTGAALVTAEELQAYAQLGIDLRAVTNPGGSILVAAVAATGDVSINALSPMIVGTVDSTFHTIDGVTAATGDANLRSLTFGNAGIAITQPIFAADTVRLDTRGSLVSSGMGRITAPTLIIGGGVATDDERPTLVDLLNITGGGDTNEVAVVDVRARGQVLFRNDGSLLIQRIATSDFVMVLNDGSVQIVEVNTNASGDVAIVADNGDIELLGGPGTAGIIADGQAVLLDARSGGATVFDAGTGDAFGTITAAQLKVLADSGIFLDADHSVSTFAALNRTGDLRFHNMGTLTIGDVGPIAGVAGDGLLSGVTTQQAMANDLIRIESQNGSILVDRDIVTSPNGLLLPPDQRMVELRADNGMIFGLGRTLSPRLEAYARNGIQLEGDNQVGTLLAHVTGGFGPFPPLTPNGILFKNAADLIVESALAPGSVQLGAVGNLRMEHAVAGANLFGHATADLIVADRGLHAETLHSGGEMSLHALNDVLMEDGARVDAGTLLMVNAIRDITQGFGATGAEVVAGSNILYEAGRAIQVDANSAIASSGFRSRFLAGGEVGGLGIQFGSGAIVNMLAGGDVLLDAAVGGIGQAGSASIRATALEALAGMGVNLIGPNQVSQLAGNASNGGFFFNNTVAPLLTIASLNIDSMGPATVGVSANGGNVQINTQGGSMLVANPVEANGGSANLTALADIDVPSSVFATQMVNLLAQLGSIDVSGVVNGNAGSTMQALAGIDISGSIFGGSTTGYTQAGSINISGLIDVNGNAIMTTNSGPIVVTGTGSVNATNDAALIAAQNIDMAGTINATLAELNAGGAIEAIGTITAEQLLALAELDINLTGGNVVANFAGSSASGSIFFNNNGDLVITNLARAGGGSATGARAINGNITIVNTGGTVTVAAVSGPTIQAILADLRVTGGQLVGSGIISAPQLRALANQGIALTGANLVGTLAAGSSGAILFNNQGNLIIGDVTGTNGITTVGVQSPSTVSLFSQAGSLDVQSQLNAGERLNLVARQGGITGLGQINTPEAFLLANNDILLLDQTGNIGSLAASSLGGSVRVATSGGLAINRLTLSEPLRQVAGITAEQATIDGFFASHQLEVRANGNININVDQLVALNSANAAGNQDAIILDTGYSAANPNRQIVINGLPGSGTGVTLATQLANGQGNGGNIRLFGNIVGPGKNLAAWAGPNGTVEFAGDIGAFNQRLGSVIVGDRNNDLQSFRDNGNTLLRGDVFVADRLLIQGNTTIADRLGSAQSFLIDVGGGTMELFGDVHSARAGQTLRFAFDLNEQYEVLDALNDEFAVRVPLRFYGSIGTEANPFQAVQLGNDLAATLASTVVFIDRDLRLNELGQFNVNALSNIHTDQAFNIWTTNGVTMGDGQRMLVLGDLNIRAADPMTDHFLSDITVIGTPTLGGFVGGNLLIDGHVNLLTRPQPLEILDRFTVLPSNALNTQVQPAFDRGVDLIASSSIDISGGVRRIVGRAGNGFLSTQNGGSISVGGSDFAFRSFGGSVNMADALIAAAFPGTEALRIGPVVAFDLVATGPTNDNLGEALADALPELEAAEVSVSASLDARDIDVLQRELGLAVDTTPTPSDLAITTGQPRANAPTQSVANAETVTASAPPVLRERVSPEGVRQVVLSIFDAFGTAETIDSVRFPEFGDRRDRFAAFGSSFQAVYDEDPNLAAFRTQVFEQAATDADAAVVAGMLAGVDTLMHDVHDLGLTESELETIYSVLADRFLNQAGLTEQFVGDTPFNATLVRELLGFPPARNGAAATTETASTSEPADHPAISLRTGLR